MQRICVTSPRAPRASDTRAPRPRAPARPRVVPASAAIVRATRATRARPRPDSGSRSTALERSSEAASVRRGGDREQLRASVEHARAHGCRRLRRRRRELRGARPRHRDGEVEAVEQRARELLPVRGEPLRRARALDRRIAAAAARAHVHRPDELEARREERVPADPRDRDEAVLERLPQRLEHRPRELGQLVHEQDAPMRERDLAGTRARPTSHDRRRRRPVVRSPKGRHGHERAPGRQQPGDRVDARHLERLVARERAAGCPAGAGRASSCRCPAGPSAGGCASRPRRSRARVALAPGHAGRRDPEPRRSRAHARRSARTRARRCDRGSTRRPRARCRTATGSIPASAASGADSAAQTRRRSPARRAPSATASVPATGRMRPSSASSPTAACSASRSGGSCLVAPSTASEIGRSKPDPSLRSAAGARLTVMRRLSGHSSAAETTPLRTRCFASWHARSASPTIAKPGNARLEMRLDLDLPRLEPDECVGDRACEHHSRVPGRRSRVVTVFRQESYKSATACSRGRTR